MEAEEGRRKLSDKKCVFYCYTARLSCKQARNMEHCQFYPVFLLYTKITLTLGTKTKEKTELVPFSPLCLSSEGLLQNSKQSKSQTETQTKSFIHRKAEVAEMWLYDWRLNFYKAPQWE